MASSATSARCSLISWASLWRRIGDTDIAAEWFDRVADEVLDVDAQQWLIAAAHQQRDCPREWFG